MPNNAEQRQLTRYLIQLPLLLKPRGPAPGRTVVGWTLNLSEAGTCVELAEELLPPMPLQVRLQTIRGPIEVEGQVIWIEDPVPGGGIPHGVTFTRIPPDQLQALRDLLRSKGKQRQAIRLPVDLALTCQAKGPGTPPLTGRTGDMSRGGLLLCLPQVVSAGTELALTLRLPRGPLTVEGTIAWVEPPERRTPGGSIRHGLRFSGLSWSTSLSLGLFLLFAAEASNEIIREEQGQPRGG
jgi:hypothetical protein